MAARPRSRPFFAAPERRSWQWTYPQVAAANEHATLTAMAHHHHGHVHTDDTRRLTIALVLILGLMVAEVVAGVLADSLALLSDAAHMLTDAGAIALALFAARLARRPASGGFTFGFRRAEILSAQLNGATLVGAGGADRAGGDPAARESARGGGPGRARGGDRGHRGEPRGHARARGCEPPQPERRGRLPARAHRPVRLHRHGDRGRGGPAHRTSRARTASPRWSWPR